MNKLVKAVKKAVKKVEPKEVKKEEPKFKCDNCEDSGLQCSVCLAGTEPVV